MRSIFWSAWAFFALSFDNLNRGSLQKRVDKIGNETVKQE